MKKFNLQSWISVKYTGKVLKNFRTVNMKAEGYSSKIFNIKGSSSIMTVKYLGEQCFYLLLMGYFVDLIASFLSPVSTFVHLSNSTKGSRRALLCGLGAAPLLKPGFSSWSLGACVCCLVRGKELTFKSWSMGDVSLNSQSSACLHGACRVFPSLRLLLLHKAEVKQFKRFQMVKGAKYMHRQATVCCCTTFYLRKSD